jgi:hypothetical protein
MYGLPLWRLTTLTLEGTYTLPIVDLKTVTLQQMQGRWLGFFHQDTLWAFDTKAYERRLRERWIFSELQISRSMPNTLHIVLTEEKPAFVFDTGTQLFGVDKKGVTSTIVGVKPEDIVQIVFTVPPNEVQLGFRLLELSDAEFFTEWNTKLRSRSDKNLMLQSIQLAAIPDRTVRFRVAGEWEIVADRTQSSQKQIDAFFAAYDQKLQGKTLQYVDVTVPARVYYK